MRSMKDIVNMAGKEGGVEGLRSNRGRNAAIRSADEILLSLCLPEVYMRQNTPRYVNQS